MSTVQKSTPSIGLHVRVKDMRNIICNYVSILDKKKNEEYTDKDELEKLRIFGIPNSKTDFITRKELKGIGDHLYPLCKNRVKENRIGSDSSWNRIPVSGYNIKYKEIPENRIKVEEWQEYCKTRGAKLYYQLSDEQSNRIVQLQEELTNVNQKGYDDLCLLV